MQTDDAGNILTKKVYGYTTAVTISTTLKDTITYTYGDDSWGDLLTAYDGNAITYDNAGNSTSLTLKNGPASGVCVVQETYGKQDTVTFTVTCTHKSGNLELFLMDANTKTILHEIPINQENTYTVTNFTGRVVQLRVACESAEFDLEVSCVFSNE